MSRAIAGAFLAELVALTDDELAPLVERLASLLPELRPEAPASPWMTADEAATFLRCRRRRIYELASDGRLTRYGDGRRLLLSRAEVARLAEPS